MMDDYTINEMCEENSRQRWKINSLTTERMWYGVAAIAGWVTAVALGILLVQ